MRSRGTSVRTSAAGRCQLSDEKAKRVSVVMPRSGAASTIFRAADFKPALTQAMAAELAEVERIAADPAAPTFDNTIAALERAKVRDSDQQAKRATLLADLARFAALGERGA